MTADRIAVTSSGVNALMLAMQALVGPGDEVVAVVPLWPNLTAQPAILGARVVRQPLRFEHGRWTLDLDGLRRAVPTRTRLPLVNPPNNPTGWTLRATSSRHSSRTVAPLVTWIVADEVYERIYFDGAAWCAPSLLTLAAADDRLGRGASFSKSFLDDRMAARLGRAPPALGPALAKLIEFNTSCAPVFVHPAALAALGQADAFVPGLVGRLKECRDTLLPRGRWRWRASAAPFRTAGSMPSSRSRDARFAGLAKRLVAEAGLGLAPGAAFGPEGEGWLRWCFASRDGALSGR